MANRAESQMIKNLMIIVMLSVLELKETLDINQESFLSLLRVLHQLLEKQL